MKQNLLIIVQVVVGILLIISVLLQQKGASAGMLFGGSGNVFSTKRGIDKFLFQLTIGLSVVFFGLGILAILLG